MTRLRHRRPAPPPLPPDLAAVWRQPALQVHLGPPVFSEDLPPGRIGDAHHARMRIAAALTGGLAPLRAAEPRDRIAFADQTRPTTAVADFPGGAVPDDIPRPVAGPRPG